MAAKAWCPWCQELVTCFDNGGDKYTAGKRQRFIVHPNKNPDRKEPDCEGSNTDI